MAYLSPRLASAAALLLPLTLAGAPALAQTAPTDVKEDSVVLQPDKVADDAPVVETLAQANLPSWSEDNARALLTFIRNIGEEGLFPKDYDPQELQAAIDSGNQIQLDKVATDAFLLLATHMRDGRTPNAARKQWFMTDSDSDSTPLIPLLDYALTANDVPMTLTGLDPVHPTFALLKSALATAKTPAEENAIRVNMERWRWMPRDLGEGYVVSNVPEYLTRVVRNGTVIATHKAVVGKASTPTPQLNPMATGVIVNPTWTLPRSIINEGIGATIANNPASARRQGYTWTGKGKTLSVVQQPGANNALGVMKLEMLNPHAIYLHDTPSKGAFAATKRAFSHGCIRTEKALHFSGLMAVMFAGATPEEFGEVVASGKTKRFEFTQPFPVYVAYWTMVPDGKGGLKKLADLYGRDAPVVASFAEPGRPTAALIAPAPPPVVPTTTTATRQPAPAAPARPSAQAPGMSGIY
ncbi:L,D-transpeptidase family protein [Sphingopyxis panaciterrulae]|uniref:Murein L,D-transpeptidase YcbB/YkuD n=1 Tax=Sphingopyxis panaciterrulae TaxID=462372 RepID=A0A7W9B8R8_9SPHN|nr:L,D-transpeptidase family protein [Sphingopyxis panaciterrulae]MBB5708288.1 murein L,D-transpeptidase YcbB/YkuD [Sphingopyxis panaciterrulae]